MTDVAGQAAAVAAVDAPTGMRVQDRLEIGPNVRISGASVQVQGSRGEDAAATHPLPSRLAAISSSRLEGNEWGGSLHIVDLDSLSLLRSIPLVSGTADLCWLRGDGGKSSTLAVGEDSGDIRLYEVQPVEASGGPSTAGAQVMISHTMTLAEHHDLVSCVRSCRSTTSSSGSSGSSGGGGSAAFLLASGSWDRSVKVWDASSPANDASLCTFHGHSDHVLDVDWDPSPEACNNILASVSRDGTLRLWDRSKCSAPPPSSVLPNSAVGACVGYIRFECTPQALSWHPSEPWIAVGCEDGSVVVVDVRRVGGAEGTPIIAKKQLHRRACVSRVRYGPAAVCEGGEGGPTGPWTGLACAAHDGTVVYASSSGAGDNKDKEGRALSTAPAHSDAAAALEWTGDRLISGGWDGVMLRHVLGD